jgi:hypothetical protein
LTPCIIAKYARMHRAPPKPGAAGPILVERVMSKAFSPEDSPTSTHAAVAFGRYTLDYPLGGSAVTEVFKGHVSLAPGPQAAVAIKRLRQAAAVDPDQVRLFAAAARVGAPLVHPNIVKVLEMDQVDGVPYVATEYVVGPTLRNLLQVAWRTADPFLSGVVRIMVDVCAALEHAHTHKGPDGQPQPVVHGDVSPDNILVSGDGVARLANFGAVGARGGTGVLQGKLQYVSPEQVRGAALDGRADVFSVGACLYEAITGRLPFDGNNGAERMNGILSGVLVKPSQLVTTCPAELEHLVLWALKPDPEQRCPDARTLGEALLTFLEDVDQPVAGADVATWVRRLFPAAALAPAPVPEMGPVATPAPIGPPQSVFEVEDMLVGTGADLRAMKEDGQAETPEAGVSSSDALFATPNPAEAVTSPGSGVPAEVRAAAETPPPLPVHAEVPAAPVDAPPDILPPQPPMPPKGPLTFALVGVRVAAVGILALLAWALGGLMAPPAPSRPHTNGVPPPPVSQPVAPSASAASPSVTQAPAASLAPAPASSAAAPEPPPPPPVVEPPPPPTHAAKAPPRDKPAPAKKKPPPAPAPVATPPPPNTPSSNTTDPEAAGGEAELAKTTLRVAEALFQGGNVLKAAKQARRAAALNPSSASAHSLLGAVLAAEGDCAAARQEFARALALDKSDARARAGQADCAGK